MIYRTETKIHNLVIYYSYIYIYICIHDLIYRATCQSTKLEGFVRNKNRVDAV